MSVGGGDQGPSHLARSRRERRPSVCLAPPSRHDEIYCLPRGRRTSKRFITDVPSDGKADRPCLTFSRRETESCRLMLLEDAADRQTDLALVTPADPDCGSTRPSGQQRRRSPQNTNRPARRVRPDVALGRDEAEEIDRGEVTADVRQGAVEDQDDRREDAQREEVDADVAEGEIESAECRLGQQRRFRVMQLDAGIERRAPCYEGALESTSPSKDSL